jgi:lipopolysaccharide cholinephosphotransferase
MVNLSIDLPKGFLDEEPKTLIVSRRRKEVWAVTLDLLVQFDKVCRKHGILYFCDGGTALGAVRHKGFVPWDDDVDVVMSRAEYAKLDAIAPTEFKHPYFWQTNETDPGSARGHAQLRNSDTTAILKTEMRDGKALYTFNQGVFIDIFPFDNLPDDEAERLAFRERLEKLKSRISRLKFFRRSAQDALHGLPSPRKAYWFVREAILRSFEIMSGRDFLTTAVRQLEQTAQRFNGTRTKEIAPVSFCPSHREVLPSHFFNEAVELDFEFLKIPVMKHHIEALAINYGNWREHVIGGAAHGGMFVHTDRPYTEYFPR